MLHPGLALTGLAQTRVYRGDPSKLPKIDPNKTVEMKSFDGYNKEFKCPSVDLQAARLPTYEGKLDAIPLTEFKISKPDFYPKTVPTQEFEIKTSPSVKSNAASIRTETPVTNTNSVMGTRQAKVPTDSVEAKEAPTPPAIAEDELKDLINQGVSAGRVRVGRGSTSKELKPTPETPLVRVKREKKSPPSEEPSQ
jgi:hypothetical protein